MLGSYSPMPHIVPNIEQLTFYTKFTIKIKLHVNRDKVHNELEAFFTDLFVFYRLLYYAHKNRNRKAN